MRVQVDMKIGWLLAIACLVMLLPHEDTRAASKPAVTESPSSESLTLDTLLQEALQRSPGLRAKKRAYEAARARVVAAWLPDDPEIGVDVEGQSSLFRFDRTDNEYMAMQTIPFPTTLLFRGQAAAKESQIAFQQYKEQERDVIWHIEQPYYELFLAKKTLAALDDVGSILERLVKTVQARYESNQAPQQDLLKAQIEQSKIGIERFQWKEKAHLAEAHLSHILDRPLMTTYQLVEEPRQGPLAFSHEQLERGALKTRPELRALELGIQRAKISRWMAATNWLPDLTGRIEARQFSGEGNIREYDTALFLTVPVWSVLKGLGGEWKGAGRDVQAAEATYNEMKNEVLLAIHEAYSKVKTAEYGLQSYELLILPQAKQQVEVAFAAYEAGRSDLLALIDAERTLRDAQIAYYQVAADYELGLSNLRLAVGGELASGGDQ